MNRYICKIKLRLMVYTLIVCQLALIGSPSATAAEPGGESAVPDVQAAVQQILDGLEPLQDNAAPPSPVLDAIASPTNQNPIAVKGTASPGATVIIRYGLAGGELQQIPPLTVDESGKFETNLPITTDDGRYVVRVKAIVDGAESFEPEYGFDYDGTAPLQPRNAKWMLLPTEKSGVVLVWEVPFKGGSDQVWDETVDHYEVYRDSDLLTTTISTSYADMNMGDMQYHEYDIVAIDRAGNKSNPAHIKAGTGYHDAILTSPRHSGGFSDGIVYEHEMNADGSKIAFISNGMDLVPQPLEYPEAYHLYIRDLKNNQTTLVGRAEMASSIQGGRLALDASGTVAAYVSDGQETPDDTDGFSDIFLYDEGAGKVQLLSEGNGSAYSPSISNDGTLIAYERSNEDGTQVVLYDRNAKKTVLVGDGQHPTISGDGNIVLYANAEGLAIYDVAQAKSEPIPLTGELEYSEFRETSLSDDGQTMAFTAYRPDGSQTVYIYRRTDRSQIEVYDTPGESRFVLRHPKLSGDGRKLLFDYVHANGNDFYAPADNGVILYDIATKEPISISNQALITEKATMDATGNKIAFISSDWEKPERRHGYLKCFQGCGDTPPGDKPITYADVYFQSMVNGQAPIGSSFTVAAIYEKGKKLQAVVTIRKTDNSESKETLELKEEEPGNYRVKVTLPPGAVQLTSVRVERADKPDIYKDIAHMPVKVAGQLKVTLETAITSLLTNTKIMATSKSKGYGNQIITDGHSEYVVPLGDADDYTVKVVTPDGSVLGTSAAFAVNNGEESLTSVNLTAIAKLDVYVKNSYSQMVPNAKVLVEKNGTSNIYMTNNQGIVNVPGVHYHGQKVKVSVLAEKPYIQVEPKEIVLKTDTNELLFDLPIMKEGNVNGKLTTPQGQAVGKPLKVIFYNQFRRVVATTGDDGQYSVDLPTDAYSIQAVSDQAPYYGITYGSGTFVLVQASSAQTKNFTVDTVAIRPMNIHLSVKMLDDESREVPLDGYSEAINYGLSVKSNSANFYGNANNIRQNQLYVQGAAGDSVTVCANGRIRAIQASVRTSS